METFKQYRIGHFARHLGVSQSFLKHYEDAGLLEATQRENGYRFYEFPQAARLLEYMRLHSYGVPIKQMKDAVSVTADEAFDNIDHHADELRKTAERLLAIVDEHDRIHTWREAMQGKHTRWEVKPIEPIYFLPHTNGQDFLEDHRIYEILHDWCEEMPVTKSALLVKHHSDNEPANTMYWGLCVTESNLRRCGIPTNDAVLVIPKTLAFVFHFYDVEDVFRMDDIASGDHPAFRKLRSLGFKPSGDALLINEMKLTRDSVQRGSGRCVIPIEE